MARKEGNTKAECGQAGVGKQRASASVQTTGNGENACRAVSKEQT